MENSEEIKTEEIKQEPVVEKKAEVVVLKSIELDERGLVAAKDNAELLRYCFGLVTSEMVPKQFNTAQKLFGALMFVRSLGLPDTSIRQVAMIQGTPTIYGDLPLALAQKSKELTSFSEQWFDQDYNIINFENKNLSAEAWGAVCKLSRGSQPVQSFSYILDDARKAGSYPGKSGTPWDKYTKLMLRYKARAIALKSLFADHLNGVSIAEYDFDTSPVFEDGFNNPRDVSEGKKKSSPLNDILRGKRAETEITQ